MNRNNEEFVKQDDRISENDVYQLLGNSRRRVVIVIMLETDGPLELRELVRRTAADIGDRTGVDANDLYKSVYVSLQQNHLPKLADRGVVEYDADRGVVAAGPNLSRFEPYVHRPPTNSPSRMLDATNIRTVVLLVVAGVLLGLLLAYVAGGIF